MQSCHENWKWGLKQIQGYKFYHPVCLSEYSYSEKEREKRKEGGREEWRKGGRKERDVTSPICEKVRHVRSQWYSIISNLIKKLTQKEDH